MSRFKLQRRMNVDKVAGRLLILPSLEIEWASSFDRNSIYNFAISLTWIIWTISFRHGERFFVEYL